MNQLFRQDKPGLRGYVSLLAFALVYLAAMVLIVAPEHLLSDKGAVAVGHIVP